MAKETKTAGKTAETPVITENNIMEQIEKKNRVDSALTEQMLADVAKEQDDRKKYELKRRYLKATYQCDLALIQRRKNKRESDIALYKVRQAGRLVRFLTGFTVSDATLEYAKTEDNILELETLNEKDKTITIVTDKATNKKETFKVGDTVPALIDIVDYDNALKKLNEKMDAMFRESNGTYKLECDKLDLSYGEYYSSSWRW